MTATLGVPTGPAGPGPSGPAGPGPGGPHGPQPSGPPPGGGKAVTAGTGGPWPSRPQGPTGPGGPSRPGRDAALLREIDDLLIRANTRAILLPESPDRIEQCGAAILEFRLTLARAAVADLLAYQSPARQRLDFAAAVADEPVTGTQLVLGDGPTPGPDAAAAAAVVESAGAVVAASAGASFSLPPTPALRPFPSRTPEFEFGAGQALYDVLPGRSS